MKITLIVPNYMQSRTFLQPPVDIYTLKTILEMHGHLVSTYDFRVLPFSSVEAANEISADTDVIVISTSPYDMTQMYHFDYRYKYVKYFTKVLKKRFKFAHIIAYGSQCTLNPKDYINETGVDFVILWEIERTILELIDALSAGTRVNDIPNIVINNRNGTLFETQFSAEYAHPQVKYIDFIPDWSSVNFKKYFGYSINGQHEKVNNWGVVLGSRGCVYNCNFCFNFFRRNVRYRDPHKIMQEMDLLESKGVKYVFFLDMTFTQNKEWAKSVCKKLIENRNRLKWICQTRCDCIDEEIILYMKKAGCVAIEFGVESFDNCCLTNLNKKIDQKRILNAFALCKKNNIAVSAFLMVGTPFESKLSIDHTMSMLKKEKVSFIPIIFTPRLGSDLGNALALKHNAFKWDKLLALRGKLSSTYDVDLLIKDHSILKGESMGTVNTNFKNEDLSTNNDHHRTQFESACSERTNFEFNNYIIHSDAKHSSNRVPFVSFPITSSCPFSCIYCGQAGENTISPVSHMSLETIMDIVPYLKNAGITKVRLTGGEPLIHPQIGDIIRFLSESGFYVLINTNGLLVEDKIDALMRTASNVHFAVSLDTLKSKRFDKISRTKNNFDKVIRGVKLLKKYGYLMRINMVVGSFNVDEVFDMISFCSELNCDLKLQEVASVPYPNSEWEDIHEDLSLLEDKLSQKAEMFYMHEYSRSFGIPVKVYKIEGVMVTLKAMKFGSRYDLNSICKDCSHYPCHEGLYDVYVLADGSIATCRWCRYGGIETFGKDIRKAISIFQNAEYIGEHELKKMIRLESNSEKVNRL